MIVIVASRYDTPARRLSERWAGAGGCLFTPADLSVGEWRYCPGDPLNSTAILGVRKVKQSEIRGVFTSLQWIWAGELADIVVEGRAYVAAEMSAFLLCWLSGLTCPVLNRPTAGCLNGPAWGREQWNAAAAQAGMRVQLVRRRAHLVLPAAEEPNQLAPVTVTVAGDRCFGETDKALLSQARCLAGVAGVDLLAVQFSGAEPDSSFVGANTSPAIATDDIADATLSFLSST